MRRIRRFLGVAMVVLLVAAGIFLVWTMARGRPADLPWTPLDLGEEPGQFTGGKLVRLRDDPARCRALLRRAGVHFVRLQARDDGPSCGWRDGLVLAAGGSRQIALSPDAPPMTCPVAAALAMWEWAIVQPAARRYLGTSVVEIEQLGTYNCRRIAGSASWSQHSTANAIDVAGFRLADGRRLTIEVDWHGNGADATFLHQVRTGGCKLYSTVLSPDYNRAHHDHLHMDQAARGPFGGRSCR